ncbi:hypothetical protein AAVH_37220 [Aphelenchoides avenae]|nr:hypothetical protein AAVH_37220 [Aphelenchus avenae]
MILKLALLGVSLAFVASQGVPPDSRIPCPPCRDDGGGDRLKRNHVIDDVTSTTLEGPVYPGDGDHHEKRDVDIHIGKPSPLPAGYARLDENDDDGDGRAEDTVEGRTDELRDDGPIGVEGPPSRKRRQSEPLVATPCPEPVVDDGEEPPIGTEGDGAVGTRKKRHEHNQVPDPESQHGLPEVGDDALEDVLGEHDDDDDRRKRDSDNVQAGAASGAANPCSRKDCAENFDCVVRRVCPRPNQCRPIARCVPDRSDNGNGPCERKDCPENFDCVVRPVCPRANQCRRVAQCVPDRSDDRDSN